MSLSSRFARRFRKYAFPKQRSGSKNQLSRRPTLELLEARHMLTASGIASNPNFPDLNLSTIPAQTATVGQPITLNLPSLGATLTDLDLAAGDTLRWLSDPDVGVDFPTGASLTAAGVFTWNPTLAQIGQHIVTIIGIDAGSPALADAETFVINVTAEDEPPVVDLNGADAGSNFSTSFTEGGNAVAIVGAGLTVTDADSTTLKGARVVITNRQNGNNEVLSFDNDGTSVNVLVEPTTGDLTLFGTATVAQYQQVLRTLKYSNTSNNPTEGDRVIEVTVTDIDDNISVVRTSTVSVIAASDPPEVDLNGPDAGNNFAATFTENDGPVSVVGGGLTVTDADSANLSEARIVITNRQDGSQEVLSVDNTGTSINVLTDPTTGDLTLFGTATVAQYQQVLRTLTYNNTSQDPTTTARSIDVFVNDGTSNSLTRTSTVSIIAQNDAPQLAVIAAQNIVVGQELVVNITASDPEGDTLTFSLDPDNSPAGATIQKTGDTTATIRWTPTVVTFPASTGFRVLVTDNGIPQLSDAESFTTTVHEVNQAPNLAAVADQAATVGQELVVNITASDANTGQTLTFALDPEESPTGATIEKTGATTATIRWTPTVADVPGPVTFGVIVTDNGFLPLVDSETFEVAVSEAAAAIIFDLNGDAEGESYTTTFTGEELDIALAAETATIGAPAGTIFNSISVRITNAFDRFDEVLSADTTDTGISAIYNDATNVLALTGPDSVENYTKVLKTLRYTNLSLDPNETARTIEIIADVASSSSTITAASFVSTTAVTAPAIVTVQILIGLDTDGDGITNKAETDFYGTNPTVFDTDGDLLPDGVEIRTEGLNPTVADDDQGDLDSDTLSNLDEVIYSTRLNRADSDRDGASDGEEVAQGSDPNDDSDLGDAPESGALISLSLTVGDHSGSHSERYNMRVGSIVHQAPEFGVVRTASYDFQKGQSYPVTIIHRGSNATTPDYDYTARIAAADGSVIFIADPQRVLGVHDESSPFFAQGKTITLHVPDIDLDILNQNGEAISESAEESTGTFIQVNNDDDDMNGVADYLDSTVTNEDDLLPMVLRKLLPGAISASTGTVRLNFDSTRFKVWRDLAKSQPITSDGTEFDITQDHQLYVEAIALSPTEAELAIEAVFVRGAVQSSLTVVGTTLKDKVLLRTGGGNLTAFRPMQGPGTYQPFQKSAVSEDLEEDELKGAVIRLNTDSDNPNGIPDWQENGSVAGENDLIEIEVTTVFTGNQIAYERSSPNLKLWTTYDKQMEIVFPDGGLISEPLELSNIQDSVFAEWASESHGVATLKLVDTVSGNALDTLTFHTSTSIVVVLSGEDLLGTPVPNPNVGIFIPGNQLYNSGFDVRLYNEDHVASDGTGAVFDEIVSGIENRGISDIAIFGYSHGGGSTYSLSHRLDSFRSVIGSFKIAFTAYVDAINNDSNTDIRAEIRYPSGSQYHINFYQIGNVFDNALFLDGEPTGAPGARNRDTDENVEKTTWGNGASHSTIDDLIQIHARIVSGVREHVSV